MFTMGAFGVIFDDKNSVLLCHRRDVDLWNLPGGMVELGEAPWECVVREIREEVGLDVIVDRLTGIYSKKQKNDLIFSFVCKKVGGVESLSDEADAVAYFSINELPKNLSPKHVERIMDAVQNKKQTYCKIQSDETGWSLIQHLNEK